MTTKRTITVVMALGLLAGCTTMESMLGNSGKKAEEFPTPVVTVKPEIDFSAETPACTVAGQRLAEHVEVGMTLKDVTRLVGKPKWKVTGSWWWSKSFTKKGKPVVRFGLQRGRDDTVITSISSDTSGCEN